MTTTNIMAILSLIFSFIFFPLGLIFGIIALKQIKQNNESGKGIAIAGVIISSIPIAVIVILTIVGFVAGFMNGLAG